MIYNMFLWDEKPTRAYPQLACHQRPSFQREYFLPAEKIKRNPRSTKNERGFLFYIFLFILLPTLFLHQRCGNFAYQRQLESFHQQYILSVDRSPLGKPPSMRCPPFFSTAKVKSKRVSVGSVSFRLVTITVFIFVLGCASFTVL